MDAVIDFEATYYISGPMTGIAEFNYPTFARVKRRLTNLGLTAKSPHEIPTPPEELVDQELWDWCMVHAMAMIESCDAIVLLPGWPHSRGACKELEYALKNNFQVYFYQEVPGKLINMSRR